MTFYTAIDICIKKNLPFAVWKKPTDKEALLIVQNENIKHSFDLQSCFSSHKGFIFYPFSLNDETPVFIRADHRFKESGTDYSFLKNMVANTDVDRKRVFHEASQQEYEQQVEDIVRRINAGGLNKAVLSRILVKEKPEQLSLGALFHKLSETYRNAFVYVVNTGDQIWCGATPEPLLLVENDEYITTAVAGTRSADAINMNLRAWNQKEREEQELVSRHIITCLNRHTSAPYSSFGPEPYPAGNVCHLKTTFTIPRMHLNGNLCDFVRDLHPTPAVCGLPKHGAFAFLSQLEQHNRSYYSGFLGPVNLNEPLSLFVNLRCMQVLEKEVAVYVGAGITVDSVPVREWEETAMKSETMLSVLKALYSENA